MTITRQDLEDAAKAAGIEGEYRQNCYRWTDGISTGMDAYRWNPLTNKADLWDLADKCRMGVSFFIGQVSYTFDDAPWMAKYFTPGNQQEAAEAVVLAAAEIWRNRK